MPVKIGGLCTNGPPLPWTATLPESGGSWPQDIPPPWLLPPPSLFSCILCNCARWSKISVHINSDMRHVCLQLLTAWQPTVRHDCSADSQQQQILGSRCANWHTPNVKKIKMTVFSVLLLWRKLKCETCKIYELFGLLIIVFDFRVKYVVSTRQLS